MASERSPGQANGPDRIRALRAGRRLALAAIFEAEFGQRTADAILERHLAETEGAQAFHERLGSPTPGGRGRRRRNRHDASRRAATDLKLRRSGYQRERRPRRLV